MADVRRRGAKVLAAARSMTAPQRYGLLVGAFFLTRSLSTLLAGADFGFPGDGWRAVGQLVVVAILLAILGSPTAARNAVIVVGVLYAVEAIIGNVDGASILGIIPVDMRDLIVHPTLALLAGAAVGWSLWRRRTPAVT